MMRHYTPTVCDAQKWLSLYFHGQTRAATNSTHLTIVVYLVWKHAAAKKNPCASCSSLVVSVMLPAPSDVAKHCG